MQVCKKNLKILRFSLDFFKNAYFPTDKILVFVIIYLVHFAQIFYRVSESIMNKTELIDAMAKANGLAKKDNEAALSAFIDAVKGELKKGGKVQLLGFGTFEVSKRAARKGRNPQTGDEIKIKASKTPKFKAGKALKDVVNKK